MGARGLRSDETYLLPWQKAARKKPGTSLCCDVECTLSGGYEHIGPCEPCGCPAEHAIKECPLLRKQTVVANTPIHYAAIDSGIREVVRRLRVAGFDTCDSGDGKSKPKVGRNLDEPHVFMKVDPAEMVAEAHRLAEFVGALPLSRKFQMRKLQPIVQLTYDPRDKSANLAFIGVGDEDLPKEKP